MSWDDSVPRGNLARSMKVGDTIQIGDDIEVTMVRFKGAKCVVMNIKAPKSMLIRAAKKETANSADLAQKEDCP
jgi:sRNA-binding carbon storage regulator CsrA